MADPGVPRMAWLFADGERRRRAWQYWVLDVLQGSLHVALHYIGRSMTIDMCSGLGAAMGRQGQRSARYAPQRQRLRENWQQLRPDPSDPNAPHPLRDGIWAHVGRVAMEFAVLDRLWAAGRIVVDGAEHVAAARATGRPVIIMAIHTGNWETIGPSLVGLGHPTTAIYQPQGNRFELGLIVKGRERYGVTLVTPYRAGALPAYRALLSRKSVLLIYVDEFMHGRVHAPTFGRPLKVEGNIANTVRMQARSDAVVIPAYAERMGGAHSKVTYLPPVEFIKTGDADADLAANVDRIDALLEPIVRAHLEQWYMLFDFRPNT